MSRSLLCSVICICVLVPFAAASAQDIRFTMTPVRDGALRLDTRTGAISHCMRKIEDWVCEKVEDNQQRARAEIKALMKENLVLRDKIERLGSLPPPPPVPATGATPSADTASPQGGLRILGYDVVDKAMEFFEKIARRFKDMIEDLKRDQRPPPAVANEL